MIITCLNMADVFFSDDLLSVFFMPLVIKLLIIGKSQGFRALAACEGVVFQLQ